MYFILWTFFGTCERVNWATRVWAKGLSCGAEKQVINTQKSTDLVIEVLALWSLCLDVSFFILFLLAIFMMNRWKNSMITVSAKVFFVFFVCLSDHLMIFSVNPNKTANNPKVSISLWFGLKKLTNRWESAFEEPWKLSRRAKHFPCCQTFSLSNRICMATSSEAWLEVPRGKRRMRLQKGSD